MANVNVGCPQKWNCLHFNGNGEQLLPAYSIRNRSCENYLFHKDVIKKIKITGKDVFTCFVNKENVILSSEPHNDKLVKQNLKTLYSKYKHKLTFEYVGTEVYPLVLNEDLYDTMVPKNKSLEYLKTKFDCML